jgi:lipase (class 3)
MTDKNLAGYAAAAYAGVPTWTQGDAFVYATDLNDAQLGNITVVAWRGTADPEDLLHDADVIPEDDPDLGMCHAGFLEDVNGVAGRITSDLSGKRVVLTGHSKGGAEALIFGAKLLVANAPPLMIVTFGAPRAGFAKLRDTLSAVNTIRQYRNGNDPVTQVPFLVVPMAGDLYMHARPLLSIGQPAPNPLDDHRIAGYQAALA